MRKVLIVLLVLILAGLFGADRYAESRAEAEVARQVAVQYRLTSEPSVSFGGFPFLTQALSGKYDSVDVSIGAFTDQGISLQDVNVRLEGLNAPLSDLMNGDASSLTADKAVASAVIPYGIVQKQLADRGVTAVARSADGNVLAKGTYSAPVVGEIPIDLTVSLRLTDEGVAIVPEKVAAVGFQVPLAAVKGMFTHTIPISGLPFGAKITGVEPVASGLKVTGEAANVPLNRAL
ncbi:DUF2993 domain-containing protein [Actinocorallia sp. A-T 12471]|uniref:LmeA family phospholipid-binding protein n=1 Tax=Actinocorallia sp. A-T 12471 TaxID=3089813 RepID=UPI0029CC1702|nr:DUF2993 domain-containing protein [Actinocorallia sp. A-T 12471]MDX6738191.1 DUF2993 domain-containing protein [Actinocorallia sp. A-T 12471]